MIIERIIIIRMKKDGLDQLLENNVVSLVNKKKSDLFYDIAPKIIKFEQDKRITPYHLQEQYEYHYLFKFLSKDRIESIISHVEAVTNSLFSCDMEIFGFDQEEMEFALDSPSLPESYIEDEEFKDIDPYRLFDVNVLQLNRLNIYTNEIPLKKLEKLAYVKIDGKYITIIRNQNDDYSPDESRNIIRKLMKARTYEK